MGGSLTRRTKDVIKVTWTHCMQEARNGSLWWHYRERPMSRSGIFFAEMIIISSKLMMIDKRFIFHCKVINSIYYKIGASTNCYHEFSIWFYPNILTSYSKPYFCNVMVVMYRIADIYFLTSQSSGWVLIEHVPDCILLHSRATVTLHCAESCNVPYPPLCVPYKSSRISW